MGGPAAYHRLIFEGLLKKCTFPGSSSGDLALLGLEMETVICILPVATTDSGLWRSVNHCLKHHTMLKAVSKWVCHLDVRPQPICHKIPEQKFLPQVLHEIACKRLEHFFLIPLLCEFSDGPMTSKQLRTAAL